MSTYGQHNLSGAGHLLDLDVRGGVVSDLSPYKFDHLRHNLGEEDARWNYLWVNNINVVDSVETVSDMRVGRNLSFSTYTSNVVRWGLFYSSTGPAIIYSLTGSSSNYSLYASNPTIEVVCNQTGYYHVAFAGTTSGTIAMQVDGTNFDWTFNGTGTTNYSYQDIILMTQSDRLFLYAAAGEGVNVDVTLTLTLIPTIPKFHCLEPVFMGPIATNNSLMKRIDSQGTWIQWNRVPGDGATYLLNQKGVGTGGMNFGFVTTSDVVTTHAGLDSTGKLFANSGFRVLGGTSTFDTATTFNGNTTFNGSDVFTNFGVGNGTFLKNITCVTILCNQSNSGILSVVTGTGTVGFASTYGSSSSLYGLKFNWAFGHTTANTNYMVLANAKTDDDRAPGGVAIGHPWVSDSQRSTTQTTLYVESNPGAGSPPTDNVLVSVIMIEL